MVQKHARRIAGYTDDRVHLLLFFDIKSYCILAFMMAFGVLLRKAGCWPGSWIRTFYAGLGATLPAAGVGCLVCFARRIRKPEAARGRRGEEIQ